MKIRVVIPPEDLAIAFFPELGHAYRVGKWFETEHIPPAKDGYQSSWQIKSKVIPLIIIKAAGNKRTRAQYFTAPGVPGLVFTDSKRPRLEKRDTRRNSDWDKCLHDKRVARRMKRQLRKVFG